MPPTTRHLRTTALLAAAAAAAGVAAPTPAAAADFGCEASAIRGTVLGNTVIEPAVANRGSAVCSTRTAGLNAPLPALLSAGAVTARTAASGTGTGRTALAAGGLADVSVRALPELPLRLPTPELGAALANVTVPLTTLLQTLLRPLVPGLAGALNLDIRPALQALLPDGRLPNVELIGVRGAMAFAGASCVGGVPRLTGDSRVAGLTVLGQELPLNGPLEQVLTLLDTGSIDPSSLNIDQLLAPLGIVPTGLLAPLRPLVQSALDALPTISIPAGLAQVKVTPGTEERLGGTLRRQALRVQVSVAGQSLADVVIGEAIVRSAGVACAPGVPTATDLVLGCTTRRLVLTDVQQRDGRVRLLGVADRKLAGKRVAIRFRHTGKTVARATVRPDGGFSATAPLPARSIRSTNKARYDARIGSERSLSLKLTRRMVISGTRGRAGKVTLSGRVVRPLAAPARSIVVTQRVSCKSSRVVKRIKPSRSGRFRVVLDAPEGQLAAVYRLSTRVRKTVSNRKTYKTFTLPRAVELG